MTHPDTLTIPRAVVEQALAAMLGVVYGDPVFGDQAKSAITSLRAALQPQAAELAREVVLGGPEVRARMLEAQLPKYTTAQFSNLSSQAHGYGQAAAEPVAYLIYAGVCDMRPVYPAHRTLGDAQEFAGEIKNVTKIVPLYTTPPATQAALTAALDYLWVVVEHNRLHFGDSHNTVIQGKAAIAQIEALGVK